MIPTMPIARPHRAARTLGLPLVPCFVCMTFLLAVLSTSVLTDPVAKKKASDLVERAGRSFAGGQYAKAAEELVQSLRLNPQQPGAAKQLGLCYQLLGELKQAENSFIEAAKLDGNDPETWFFLGRVYYLEHAFDNALNVLKTAVRLDFRDPQIHELLALNLETVGDTEGALREYTEAVRWNNKMPKPLSTPHLSYGVFLHKLNRPKESETQLRIATRLNPKDWMAHFELGKLLYDLNKFEAALQELTVASQTATRGGADVARVYRLLGRIYYRMGRDDDALRAIAMADK